MSTKRMIASAALGVCLLLTVVAAPASASAQAGTPASSSPKALPQVSSALSGATWLAGQLNSSGYVPSSTSPGTPDLTSTVNVVLALASAHYDAAASHQALTYLESHVNAYVKVDGSDGPGQLALLILDAHALGVNPEAFGGTNLVSRLLATERTSGASKGLFGAQSPTYDGAFRQGLSLAALAGAGVTTGSQVGSAETWLLGQQCPDGGWTSFISSGNPCDGNPADYEGPDTNSTALAIQGLSAQGALGAKPAGMAQSFLTTAEDHDGGWGYEPNAKGAPGSTDPDSTALVIQAILALGLSPSATTYVRGSADPVSTELSFQLTSGSGKGAFEYPGETGADMLATYQAVPAVAGVKLPFNLAVTTSSLHGGTVGTAYSSTLAAHGGHGTYTWSLVSGSALPAGLSLASRTGVISGKPTKAGTSSFNVEVTDTKTTTAPRTQSIAWKKLSLTVSPA
jgi:hypothetical protein